MVRTIELVLKCKFLERKSEKSAGDADEERAHSETVKILFLQSDWLNNVRSGPPTKSKLCKFCSPKSLIFFSFVPRLLIYSDTVLPLGTYHACWALSSDGRFRIKLGY